MADYKALGLVSRGEAARGLLTVRVIDDEPVEALEIDPAFAVTRKCPEEPNHVFPVHRVIQFSKQVLKVR